MKNHSLKLLKQKEILVELGNKRKYEIDKLSKKLNLIIQLNIIKTKVLQNILFVLKGH